MPEMWAIYLCYNSVTQSTVIRSAIKENREKIERLGSTLISTWRAHPFYDFVKVVDAIPRSPDSNSELYDWLEIFTDSFNPGQNTGFANECVTAWTPENQAEKLTVSQLFSLAQREPNLDSYISPYRDFIDTEINPNIAAAIDELNEVFEIANKKLTEVEAGFTKLRSHLDRAESVLKPSMLKKIGQFLAVLGEVVAKVAIAQAVKQTTGLPVSRSTTPISDDGFKVFAPSISDDRKEFELESKNFLRKSKGVYLLNISEIRGRTSSLNSLDSMRLENDNSFLSAYFDATREVTDHYEDWFTTVNSIVEEIIAFICLQHQFCRRQQISGLRAACS